MKAVEKYYSLQELGWLVGQSVKTMKLKMDLGEFGPDCVNLGSDEPGGADYRVPASGFNAWLERRRVFSKTREPGIAARSVGELRRKARAAFSEELAVNGS